MLSAAFAALLSYPFLMLRIGNTAGSFPKPLSAAEEHHYIELCTAGDEHARNVLIERNLRLVAHIIKKYYTQADDQDDLISIGTIGLIKGISTFDASKGARLATYAARCVENEILMHFRAGRKSAQDVSLSDFLDTGSDGAPLALMDVISEDVDLVEQVGNRETIRQLRAAVDSCLTEQERTVIRLRYGLDNDTPLRQREVANRTGLSRSYISRIEKRALGKLKAALE